MGGSHVSAMDLIGSLDNTRFEPRILIHYQAGKVGEYAKSLGLDFDVLPDTRLLGSSSFRRPNDANAMQYMTHTFPNLLRLLKRDQIDIVHTNEGRLHNNWTFPSNFSKSRHLWHHRQDPKAFGVNKLAPIFADFIVSVSKFASPVGPIVPVSQKLRVVRSPFTPPQAISDRTVEHKKICNDLNLPEDSILLGYFGALTNRKRPVHFVDAISAVHKRLPQRKIHGLLFGESVVQGSDLNSACRDRAADLGIAGNIHLMGFRKPISGYMAGVDATLVTALNEPFGRTLIEAMYLGTPVIATRHGGNPEAIVDNETGFLVDHESPEAFAEPVLKLLQDPELYERISSAAQKNAQSNYGRSQHVNAISEIYDQLVPPNR